MCYHVNMNLEEALEKVRILELEIEIERTEKFFYLNEYNKILKLLEASNEKVVIARVKAILPKTEVNKSIVVNETEEVIKDNKIKVKRKAKSKDFANFDFESLVSETRYERSNETVCESCGLPLEFASSSFRYIIERIPSSLKVIKIVKENYKCGQCNNSDHKLYFHLSDSVFPGSILTPSFASYICYHKYELGIPFEHLSRHIKATLRINLSKQNLALYMAKMSDILDPIYNKMRKDLLNNTAQVIHADETTLSVSKRPNADSERKKSYVYVYVSSYFDKQIAIYDFHESRAIDRTAKWMENYKGTIVCDDFAGYTKLKKDNPNIGLQRCFAHVRRRYVDIVKALPENKIKDSHANKVLLLIGELFQLEESYKTKKLLPSEVLKLRKVDQPPIIEKLRHLVFDYPVLPSSAIANAINYTKKVWPDLFTYIDNPYVEISNNIAERAIKPFVLQRKVFMTSGSYAGATYTTKLFSIIRTARLNGLDVEAYLEYLLNNINCRDVEELVPYNIEDEALKIHS